MEDFNHLCGALIDEALRPVSEAVCVALSSQGKEPLFKDARPDLTGYANGKCVLLQDAETVLFGKTLPSFNQDRGTCSLQGTGRAAQDTLYNALVFGDLIGKPVAIAAEALYGIARQTIGRYGKASAWGTPQNRVGGDGCSGCELAQAAHDYGYLQRGTYGSIDLTCAREDLAIQWGNAGTPAALMMESATYKASACMKCTSLDELADGIAAFHAATICGPLAAHGQRDADGLCPLQPSGGHCEECCGVYIDMRGDLIFVVQNSWGRNGPTGGGTFKLKDGREVQPREGSCGVRPEQMQTFLRRGEIWLLGVPKNPWIDPSLKPSDLAA